MRELARHRRSAARRGADERGAVRDPLARGARVSSSRARTAATGSRAAAARRGSVCSRSATGPGTRSRRRCARRTKRAPVPSSRTPRCARSHRRERLARDASRRRRELRRRGGHRRARRGRPLLREAETRGELSTNHPNATGEVTRIALDAGAETRDLDALQYHPNGGAWPSTMQGYSIPETTRAYGAVLLNADGEEFTDSLGPRDAVSRRSSTRSRRARACETPDGRPAV